ncbi:MAG: lipopolysaccharide transporter permease [Phycisphaerales bacterium]|nr:lipopolysaccharide transporter permease [Phycisphaerales bacterium]
MKILTRYILFNYLRNYVISLFVLIGLYIVLDMVLSFDDFAVTREGAGALGAVRNIASYYFYQSFRIFAQLSGVIPVTAAAFTFLRLSRFNELTAMMAAGMHLVRVAAPAIIAAVVVSLIFPLINQEIVIPAIIPHLQRSRSDVADAREKANAIQNLQDENGGLLFASGYKLPANGKPAVMEKVTVLELAENFDLKACLTADKAVYDSKQAVWELTNGQRTTDLAGRHRDTKQITEYKSNVTPEEIALFRSGDYVDLLSTPRINDLLQRTQVYGSNDLMRVKHARLAQLLLNIIMVLLAISSVLIREQGQLKYAMVKCMVLVGGCMVTIFVCQSLASLPPSPQWVDRWPALMAWVPIFVFGPLSVFLLDRVKT